MNKEKQEIKRLKMLLTLPDILRKTYMQLEVGVEVTATDVSKKTGRARAVESANLNQLTIMGYVKKRNQGHFRYFFIP